MSEKRDLWVPFLLALGGAAILAWHIASPVGDGVAGGAALLLGLLGGLACLPIRIKQGQGRVMAFGAGVALLLVMLMPGTVSHVAEVIAFLIAALAFLLPLPTASEQLRKIMLGAGALFALLAMLTILGVLPKMLTWLFVAGAVFMLVQMLQTRETAAPEPPPGPRVCVFGGSFDPYHSGHRALCEAALGVCDRLLIVVAGASPHKFAGDAAEEGTPDRTPFHHRVAMTRLGAERLPRTEVLEMEGKRQGPSYTVDTLEVLMRSHAPGTRFHLLIGADLLGEFHTWREWERILAQVTLLVAARPGSAIERPAAFADREVDVKLLEAPRIDVSSSGLRAEIRDGKAPDPDLLAPSVLAYIQDHGLYRDGGA